MADSRDDTLRQVARSDLLANPTALGPRTGAPTAAGFRGRSLAGDPAQAHALGRGRIVLSPRDIHPGPQPSDSASEEGHGEEADAAAAAADQAKLTPLQRAAEASLRGEFNDADAVPELEDMYGKDPRLTADDVRTYLTDKASGTSWEDWIGQYTAEKDAAEQDMKKTAESRMGKPLYGQEE